MEHAGNTALSEMNQENNDQSDEIEAVEEVLGEDDGEDNVRQNNNAIKIIDRAEQQTAG